MSSPSTMSMPLSFTTVRLSSRCGRARPTIISTPATIASSHIQRPARLRVARATSPARATLEYSIAATGPGRPRQIITSGTHASSQNHWG